MQLKIFKYFLGYNVNNITENKTVKCSYIFKKYSLGYIPTESICCQISMLSYETIFFLCDYVFIHLTES